MFERLSEGLSQALARLGGRSDDDARRAFLDAVRDSLLAADTHPDVVGDLVQRLGTRLARPNTDDSLAPSQRFLKDLHDEIRSLLGKSEPLRLKSAGLSTIMLVGLQGTGKTTTAGKLAKHLAAQGKRVILVPIDVKRPAAIEQLTILGRSLGIDVYPTEPGSKPLKAAVKALKSAADAGYDVALFDTAGRLAIDRELMRELAELRAKLKPQEILYVLDAMAGQTAVSTAEQFVAAVKPTGIIVSKVDADSRGGAVLSVRARTGLDIKFMGVGEKSGDLEPWDAARIASRLLDLGDLQGLAEKFDAAVDEDEAMALSEKFLAAKFDLNDFAKQLEMMRNLGSLESLLGMLPGGKGILKQVKDLSVAEKDITRTLAIIRSMTPQERSRPKVLSASNSRKRRIAAGSGTSVGEVNRMLKRYEQMQKMMKRFSKSPLAALKGLMGGGLPPGISGPGGSGLPPGLLGR